MLEELFTDICLDVSCTVQPIQGMDEPLSYRHKALSPLQFIKGKIVSGFYKPGTHLIIPCETCLVEHPEARAIIQSVAYIARDLKIPAYNEDTHTGVLRHVQVRCSRATGEVMLLLVIKTPQLKGASELVKRLRATHPCISSIVLNHNDRKTNAVLGFTNTPIYGDPFIHEKLLDCTFEVGATSFFQTNPAQTEVLYQHVINAVQDHIAQRTSDKQSIRVLDAYCGTGTIGLCIAKHCPSVEVLGVESNKEAVRRAGRNARLNKLESRATFICDDATKWMRKHAADQGKLDVVVLDPPRAGTTLEFISSVAALAPACVVYVSCNPTTLVRDVRLFAAQGYVAHTLIPVDMFPHTKHVECVCLMTRVR